MAKSSTKFGSYITERGDVVWIDFMPQVGREQAGRRPAIVISGRGYNGKVGLALVCPITNKTKGYPMEIPIPEDLGVSGVILADQVKSFDWNGRKAELMCKLPSELVDDVIAALTNLLN
ncbi:MAG: mRNA-degrading endonuclease [Okeania sp. SIO2H7]|nr:mRNA-degrading endonuclease [Okeania sp. SIO2H7]